MAEQAIHEMVAAFASGCMDNDNFVQFKNYMNEGGGLPVEELAELQNIISIIPVILELEKPNAEVKNLVAKKLMSMKDEIKAKIKKERRTLIASFPNLQTTENSHSKKIETPSVLTQKQESLKSSEAAPSETSVQDVKKKFGEPRSAVDRFKKIKTDEQPPLILTSQQQKIYPQVAQGKNGGSLPGWIALIFSLILFSILSFYTFTTINSLNDQIDDLQNGMIALKSELSAANNFISNYSSLVEFFNYKDIFVVNLTRPEGDNNASARLLLSFNEKEGLIQFKNIQPLQPNQSYQLWMYNRGQAYSLGMYQPVGSEYLKLTTFPFLPKEQIELFKVTIESGGGPTSPSTTSFLESSAANPNLPGKFRR